MTAVRRFPFGEAVRIVEQVDRTPKRVFVLGVYASAVHARWLGPDRKERVRALAVASEPYIFWRGDGVDDIIGRITLPPAVGTLVAADAQLNGPSGRALDEHILHPLGVDRGLAWLCDLVPFSCANKDQLAAVAREYTPLTTEHGLPISDVRGVPKALSDPTRHGVIAAEFTQSEAPVLVLLGDEPIRCFLKSFESRWTRLSDFGDYGHLHAAKVAGRTVRVLPLAHPRQIAGLGAHSPKWREQHDLWLKESVQRIRAELT